MALLVVYSHHPIAPTTPCAKRSPPLLSWRRSIGTIRRRRCSRVHACFNPFEDQPILKDALKEPMAFLGGVFAGLLRLDLNEEPLREWVARTVESSGITVEGGVVEDGLGLDGEEDAPQQIEIE
ncbi:hypothetical protein J5N97_022863 [Dioscorea zingiberensis]|uniref:Uncharacterized protein n=1 Tax=Dioscorea zingiberensis TaxID=325984 RepID=A0A9D5CBD1_9LILI|nr:hypothetical protein J5N97_022863 [Dioscorea zingiberensis]